MPGLSVMETIDMCTKEKLLSVIRAMAEDLVKCQHPSGGCPTHGQSAMRRDKNGIKYCCAAGCGYESSPGSEPSMSAIVNRYLERVDVI